MNEHPTVPPAGGTPQHPAQPGPSQPPQGQPYPGQPSPGQPGQPYPGQPYAGQPYPGQPGPYAGPPAGAPQQPRRSWFARHKVLTVVGALVALVVVVSALGGGGDDAPAAAPAATTAAPKDDATKGDATPEEKDEPTQEPQDTLPGVGDTVRDGKFEFVVTKVADGGTSIGPAGFATKAQGRFVLVHVDVTNIGDEPQYFFGDNQTVFDAEDRKFAADTTAAIYLEDSSSFIEEINPGNTVEGTLVFDLPEGVDPVRIELHDSMLSGGVVVGIG